MISIFGSTKLPTKDKLTSYLTINYSLQTTKHQHKLNHMIIAVVIPRHKKATGNNILAFNTENRIAVTRGLSVQIGTGLQVYLIDYESKYRYHQKVCHCNVHQTC